MDRDETQTRGSRIAGSLLIYLPGLAVAMSAILKFAGVPSVVHQMAASGFSDGKLTLVASVELSSAVLFLYPRTRSLGLLLLSSFLGGAICTHVQMGEYAKGIGPAVLLTVAWIGIWLRHSQSLWSLNRGAVETSQLAPEGTGKTWASKSA